MGMHGVEYKEGRVIVKVRRACEGANRKDVAWETWFFLYHGGHGTCLRVYYIIFVSMKYLFSMGSSALDSW